MKITLGNKEYNVEIADTDELRYKGLRNREELPEDSGMLFVWDKPQAVSMTMEDTLIPLDLIFINDDYEVTKVAHREDIKEDNLIGKSNTLMVLELNLNSGVKVGDELDFVEDEPDKDEKLPIMKVLAPDGSTLMELEGGERIFSRKNTKILIKLAKKAYSSKSDSDYKRLGKSVFKFLKILDNNTPEYVEAPK